ncbi:hypothetical protein OF83DRAFT_852540 [Amylostereum chailletii]|nr:hypothetical protein OF83DRAFT_852540 [Amylostereum chailletii]
MTAVHLVPSRICTFNSPLLFGSAYTVVFSRWGSIMPPCKYGVLQISDRGSLKRDSKCMSGETVFNSAGLVLWLETSTDWVDGFLFPSRPIQGARRKAASLGRASTSRGSPRHSLVNIFPFERRLWVAWYGCDTPPNVIDPRWCYASTDVSFGTWTYRQNNMRTECQPSYGRIPSIGFSSHSLVYSCQQSLYYPTSNVVQSTKRHPAVVSTVTTALLFFSGSKMQTHPPYLAHGSCRQLARPFFRR